MRGSAIKVAVTALDDGPGRVGAHGRDLGVEEIVQGGHRPVGGEPEERADAARASREVVP